MTEIESNSAFARWRDTIRRRLGLLIGAPAADLALLSPDGSWIAQAVPDPASDMLTWQIVPAGPEPAEALPDLLKDVYPTGIAWLPDGAGFFYDRWLPYPGAHGLYFHRAGSPQAEDACLLYQPAHPAWYYQPTVSPDGCWLAVSVLNGSAANRLTLISLADPTANPAPVDLIPAFVGRYDILHWQPDRLILRAVEPDAPNGRLIALDLPGGARTILLPETDLPLQDAAPLADGWAVHTFNRGRSDLRWLGPNGERRATIPLPGLGTVDWLAAGTEDTARLHFAYTGYAHPIQTYTWQPGDTHPQPEGDSPALAFDPADFVTRAHTVTSADGTPIPCFLAHRRDTALENVPTLLTAYGGMGHSLTPRFAPDIVAWMEMGGVYASVCARGGGELGAQWHQAAVGAAKQRTFDDVLAAARWLMAEGITCPARLGLWGTSNGGLTAGACLTQQPDLFAAVVIEAGLLDMLDYPRLGRGAEWLAEYGSPDRADDRQVLAAYSPLHAIRPGQIYPPTLITTHAQDARVGAEHSLRFAQALQSARAGDAPVRLRVDPGAGHGHAPDAPGWLDAAAHRLAFFAVHLGMQP